MKNGEQFDYDFGVKRNWRRWAWNRIAERATDPRHSMVLYLPGHTDEDRPIAISKGFQGHNLIGIDKSKQVAAMARGIGTQCAIGDFFKGALCLAGPNKTVGVLFGDFCNGASWDAVQWIAACMVMPQYFECVFAFNFMRGRDQGFNAFREALNRDWDFLEQLSFDKHRGFLAFVAILMTVAGLVADDLQWDATKKYNLLMNYMALSNPDWRSYRSTSGQYFDSIVFRNPASKTFDHKKRHNAAEIEEKCDSVILDAVRSKDFTKTRQSMAAVMAHRTRKLG